MRCILALAILLTALVASAQEPVKFEWKSEMQPGQTLEIRNINGNIKAEAAEGTEATVSVRITGTHPDPTTIRIDMVPHEGGVVACTIYLGFSHPEYCTPKKGPSTNLRKSDVKVDYFVRVPAGVKFVANNVNGRVTADLPESEIRVNTVSGRIAVATSQPVEANTVSGSIVASLDGHDWTGARRFHVVSGSVDVDVPADASASVRASTISGWITTEFPIPVRRGVVGSWMKGDLGEGGPLLEMSTVNGSIHLRKQSDE